VYRKFIISGELSVEELSYDCPEIKQWFKHSESKITPLTIESLSLRVLSASSTDLIFNHFSDNAI